MQQALYAGPRTGQKYSMSDGAPKPAGSARKGRGATLNLQGRFERLGREAFDDGWQRADDY